MEAPYESKSKKRETHPGFELREVCKLSYFGNVMRLPYENTESSIMVGFVEGIRGYGGP